MDKAIELNTHQKERYLRQILIPDIGEGGQIKLLNSSVVVVGAGGLGSSQILYLQAAGFGRIGIIDSDTVAVSNLNRQILYNDSDIGKQKAQTASSYIKFKNPEIETVIYPYQLNKDNAEQIFREYDIILDATDNFETRYIINKTCFNLRKPWIFGGVRHFVGEYAVFDFRNSNGSCLECMFPDTKDFDNNKIPIIEKGVIGITPGIIGLYQVTAAIKLILKIGKIKHGVLILEDFLENIHKEIKISQNLNCSVCGVEKK